MIKFNIVYIIFLFSVANNCALQTYNGDIFKKEVDLYYEKNNCRTFYLNYSNKNQWHFGLGNDDLESSYSIYPNIKKGVELAIANHNEQCISKYREEVIFEILIYEMNEPNFSRNSVINAILSYLSLTIIPNYNDLSYSISYSTKNYKFKTNRNFLIVFSFFNIFLFFRYEEPFISDFIEITNEFLANYYESLGAKSE